MKRAVPLFIIAIIASAIGSCKLDPPIYPPPGGATGSSGSTGTVSVTELNAKWTVKSTTVTQSFAGDTSTQITANFFKSVTIDTAAKISEFVPELQSIPNYVYSFVLTGSGSSLAISFDQDPFPRNVNGPVQITKLTSTTMVWLAAYQPTMVTGYNYEIVYQVTFTK